MNKTGRIVRQISNLYTVLSDNKTFDCRARGKFRNDALTPLVGDFVTFDDETKYILDIKKRKNEMGRPTIANADVALIITSVKKPDLSLTLLDKQLVQVIASNIEPIICLTKLDLAARKEKKELKKIFAYYKKIGIKVLDNDHLSKIKKTLKNKVVVLTGQTGAGKSTLLNKLDKSLNLKTNEISKALNRGVHTTRHTELYKVATFLIADTPGFSSLDLKINKELLKSYFPEFRNKTCKFEDCAHIKETGCEIKRQVEEKKILKSRYENYVRFWSEL